MYVFMPRTLFLTYMSSQEHEDSDAFASLISRSPRYGPLKNPCRGTPTIIGRCQFNLQEQNPIPTAITLWGRSEETYSFVLYRPHAPNSLRFYAFTSPQPTSSSFSADHYSELSRYDFTQTHPLDVDEGLNETVIHQACPAGKRPSPY